MSRIATTWALEQRGLKPAAKIVLIQLADHHNKETGQCNPRISTLAEECEMNRATVFRHLTELEARGLIRRVETYRKDGARSSSHYELNMAASFDVIQSQDATPPVAKCDTPRRNCATPPVATVRPLNRTRNINREEEPCTRIAFDEFWSQVPSKIGKANAEKAWKKLAPDDRAQAAKSAEPFYAWWRKQNPDASWLHPSTYLNGKRWQDEGWQSPPSQQSDDYFDKVIRKYERTGT